MRAIIFRLGSAVGLAALMFSTAGQAQTLSPQGPITATGVMNVGFKGTATFNSVCEVVFQGVADAAGFTLTSVSGTQTSGLITCTDDGSWPAEGWVLPIRANITPDRQVRFENLAFVTRLGDCMNPDVLASWDDAGSRVDVTADKTFCRLSGSLTISPPLSVD